MAALPTADPDEMLAAVTKWKTKFTRGGGGGNPRDRRPRQDAAPRRDAGARKDRPAGDRPARKCPNCGNTHADRIGPHPTIAG